MENLEIKKNIFLSELVRLKEEEKYFLKKNIDIMPFLVHISSETKTHTKTSNSHS